VLISVQASGIWRSQGRPAHREPLRESRRHQSAIWRSQGQQPHREPLRENERRAVVSRDVQFSAADAAKRATGEQKRG
jgi:hypothetical protein